MTMIRVVAASLACLALASCGSDPGEAASGKTATPDAKGVRMTPSANPTSGQAICTGRPACEAAGVTYPPPVGGRPPCPPPQVDLVPRSRQGATPRLFRTHVGDPITVRASVVPGRPGRVTSLVMAVMLPLSEATAGVGLPGGLASARSTTGAVAVKFTATSTGRFSVLVWERFVGSSGCATGEAETVLAVVLAS
jgi:hypothetical protein